MARGLGYRQKEVMKIIREALPENKSGEIRSVYSLIKSKIYPEHKYYKPSSWRGWRNLPDDFWKHRIELETARVTISKAVTGLIRRGYLTKDKVFHRTKPLTGPVLIMNEVIKEAAVIESEPINQNLRFIAVTKKGRELIID
jgi:hypothetical protein